MLACSDKVGKGQLINNGVPVGVIFFVEPKAMVLSSALDDLFTHSRSARLKGISSLSIAKKYCLKNSPRVIKT